MLISDLLNILFDQCDYPTLIKLHLMNKRKTAYAKKYSVLIHYELNEPHSFEFVVCRLKLVKYYVNNTKDIPDDVKHYFNGYVDIFGGTPFPLSLCARLGHIEIVKYLFHLNSDAIKTVNAFIASASFGHLDVIKFFVSKCHDLCFTNDFTRLALLTASAGGHLNVVEYFVRNGIETHFEDERALGLAIAHGQLDVVKYLVSIGADIHVLNERPFIKSVMHGQIAVAKYLIEAGAYVHVIGEGLLHDLHNRGCDGTVDFLCNEGCKNAIEFVEKLKVNL